MDRCLNAKKHAPAGGTGFSYKEVGSVEVVSTSAHSTNRAPTDLFIAEAIRWCWGDLNLHWPRSSGRGARTSGVTSCSSLVAVCPPSLPRSARRRLGGLVWLRGQDLNL